MFFAALIHGGFSLFQFHALGDVNLIYSLFTSNLDYNSLTNFPFQILGFFALLILFVMASTSHDFFLANLSAKVWKRLHMLVYIAYALIILHVFLGAFQQEGTPYSVGLLVFGFTIIASLHLISAMKELKYDFKKLPKKDDWLEVCHINDIETDRAKIFTIDNKRVAIFKHNNTFSAINNVCKHQGGPLGEGKIIDGCITCPWHGYQYLPHNGQSPPPFKEKVSTYELKLIDQVIFINPEPFEEGTEIAPLKCII